MPDKWRGTQSLISILALLSLSACTGVTPIPDSGIKGQVLIGPMCPAVRDSLDCPDKPFMATLEVTDLDGNPLVRTNSDEEGHFRIPLAPGEYVLVPVSPNGGAPPWAEALTFQVRESSWTEMTVVYDSGIR